MTTKIKDAGKSSAIWVRTSKRRRQTELSTAIELTTQCLKINSMYRNVFELLPIPVAILEANDNLEIWKSNQMFDDIIQMSGANELPDMVNCFKDNDYFRQYKSLISGERNQLAGSFESNGRCFTFYLNLIEWEGKSDKVLMSIQRLEDKKRAA